MTFFIVAGSSRPRSQSAKVAAYVSRVIERRSLQHRVHLLNLADSHLPPGHDKTAAGKLESPEPWEIWTTHAAALREAEAVVIVAPEWGGMAPPALKNFFLLCDQELCHKPALLVAVSATRGGSYPIAELRTSSYKNTRICYIPEHVIVHGVRDVLNAEEPASPADDYVRRRCDFALGVLEVYGEALATARTDNRLFHPDFKYGM